MCPGLVTG